MDTSVFVIWRTDRSLRKLYSHTIMQRVLRILTALFTISLLLNVSFAPHVYAAEVRTGDQVRLTDKEQTITNPYVFGGNIQIDSPIANELTTAGGDIIINSPVEGSVFIAGGNITLRGSVGNNARIAGGNITVDGPITNDLVITGGNITVTSNASVGGDILFAGGTLHLDGPVEGKALLNGGNITLNNTIGGDVSGEMGELTLASGANIAGNLSYKSPERAQVDQGATVTGRTDFRQSEDRKDDEAAKGFAAMAAFYKLIADIIITLLFIYAFRRALTAAVNRMKEQPLRSGVIGFGFFFLVPIAALFLLILLWLGIATWLFYFLAFIVAVYIAYVFVGWFVLRWWYGRSNKEYIVDWKTAIVGPTLVLILSLIPVLGWLANGIIFFIALGALTEELVKLSSNQRVMPTATPKHTTTKRK